MSWEKQLIPSDRTPHTTWLYKLRLDENREVELNSLCDRPIFYRHLLFIVLWQALQWRIISHHWRFLIPNRSFYWVDSSCYWLFVSTNAELHYTYSNSMFCFIAITSTEVLDYLVVTISRYTQGRKVKIFVDSRFMNDMKGGRRWDPYILKDR